MSKFTPGPWVVEREEMARFCSRTGEAKPEVRFSVMSTNPKVTHRVIMAVSTPTLPDAEANSRLVACAPDLLNEVYNARQVLEAVIEHLKTGEPWSDSMVDDLKSEILGMSLKIAKATGGTK